LCGLTTSSRKPQKPQKLSSLQIIEQHQSCLRLS
jgi:hypothetical protein